MNIPEKHNTVGLTVKNTPLHNSYVLFRLSSTATMDNIKTVYRKLVKQHHPDRFENEEQKIRQAGIMAQINTAYKILVDHRQDKVSTDVFPGKKETDYSLYKKVCSFS